MVALGISTTIKTYYILEDEMFPRQVESDIPIIVDMCIWG